MGCLQSQSKRHKSREGACMPIMRLRLTSEGGEKDEDMALRSAHGAIQKVIDKIGLHSLDSSHDHLQRYKHDAAAHVRPIIEDVGRP
mmetsp:Transcript_22532/g.62883  ORF Transcript_22532/g.62883 Transcript_22532/m.62883 type:complete len:87 (-) Transcript_22532:221-481(-)